MHDAGSHARAAAGKLFKVISECVRERAGMNSRRGMDDQAGGLVDYDQGRVFVDDFDRNCFGRERGGRRSNEFDFQLVVLAQFVRRLRGFAVDENVFRFDQALQARAAPAFNPCG